MTHITRPLSDFLSQLKKNEGDLRTTAILHMCSAFETALRTILLFAQFTNLNALTKNMVAGLFQIFFNIPTIMRHSKSGLKIAGEKLMVYTPNG